jgi:hypothetical protein
MGGVGELVIWGSQGVSQLRAGVYQSEGAQLGLAVGTTRWYPVTHDTMRRMARAANLPESWVRPDDRDDDIVAASFVPVEELANAAAAAEWYWARLQELAAARLLVDLTVDGRGITTSAEPHPDPA